MNFLDSWFAFVETKKIDLGVGYLPIVLVFHALAIAPCFPPKHDTHSLTQFATFMCFLLMCFSGQLMTALLLGGPISFLASNTLLPNYALIWFITHYTGVYKVVTHEYSNFVANVVSVIGDVVSLSSFGVDTAVMSTNSGISSSIIGALIMGTAVASSGSFVILLLHQAFPSTTPCTIPPDFEYKFFIRNAISTAAYYCLTDPHGYIRGVFASSLVIEQTRAKVCLFLFLLALQSRDLWKGVFQQSLSWTAESIQSWFKSPFFQATKLKQN